MTGSKTAQVAELLAISVSIKANRHTITDIMNFGKCSRIMSWSPIHWDNPDASDPWAKAKPPPSIRIIPHETLSWVVFQSNNIGDVLNWVGFAGIKKKKKTTKIAGVESLMKLN